jgi:hypothetical protein
MNRKSLDNKGVSLVKHSLVLTKESVEEESTLASHDNDHSQSSHDADFITLLSPSITVVILSGDALTNHNNNYSERVDSKIKGVTRKRHKYIRPLFRDAQWHWTQGSTDDKKGEKGKAPTNVSQSPKASAKDARTAEGEVRKLKRRVRAEARAVRPPPWADVYWGAGASSATSPLMPASGKATLETLASMKNHDETTPPTNQDVERPLVALESFLKLPESRLSRFKLPSAKNQRTPKEEAPDQQIAINKGTPACSTAAGTVTKGKAALAAGLTASTPATPSTGCTVAGTGSGAACKVISMQLQFPPAHEPAATAAPKASYNKPFATLPGLSHLVDRARKSCLSDAKPPQVALQALSLLA